jgi:hypothetical protein
MTVTVYHREGLTRHVLEGVHYEFTSRREVVGGIAQVSRGFLLVIPGDYPIHPGDKVLLGIGPEYVHWEDLTVETTDTLGVVTSVQPRYYQGAVCHIEARG